MLQINEKLRISKLDDKNLQIEQLKEVESKKLGKHKEWCWCGYYSTLKSALLGVLTKQLFDSVDEQTTLIDTINTITKAENEISDAIKTITKDKEVWHD